ncbi:hypothetical protein AAYQ19_03775 [Flavobacterium sp. D4]
MENLNIGEHTLIVSIIYLVVVIGILVYFIKNFKKRDVELKVILILAFFSAFFLIYYGIKENKKVIALRNNFSLTSGSIEEYFIPKLTGRGSHKNIKYIFKVNDDFVENQYKENYYVDIPEDKPDLDILYLVIFEKTNPKNSFILLNYPIKTSDDLDRYRELFAKKIPDDAIKED